MTDPVIAALDAALSLLREQHYTRAIELLEPASNAVEAREPGDPTRVSVRLELARALHRAGRNQDAGPVVQALLRELQGARGPKDPSLAPVHVLFAQLFEATNRSESAERQFVTAAELLSETTDPELRRGPLREALEALVRLRKALGLSGEAVAAQERLVAVHRELSGDRATATLDSLRELVALLNQTSERERAIPALTELVAVEPDNAQLLFFLGQAELARGGFTAAEQWLRRALETGTLSPRDAAQASLELGDTLRRSRRPAEALAEYERAQARFQAEEGPEGLHVGACCSRRGTVLLDLRRPAEAEPEFARAVALAEKHLGSDAPDLAWARSRHALALEALSRWDDAELELLTAKGIYERTLGPRQMWVARTLHDLNRINRKRGKFPEAERYCKEALAIRKESLGDQHPEYAESLGSYALLLEAMGRGEEAQHYHRRADAIAPPKR